MENGTMMKRSRIYTIVAVGAISLAGPAAGHAQAANPGQVVQAVAKLNAAQMAFVKKLAADAAYAKQYDAAITSGNYDAAATLVAAASGVAKSSIHISSKGTASAGELETARETSERGTVFQLASVTHAVHAPSPVHAISGKVCFDFNWVQGCIEF